MFLSGRRVGAEEALSIGLLSRLVDDPDAEADKLARALARGPAQVLREAKRMIAAAPSVSLAEQLDLERDLVARHVAEPDFEEGVRAFVEKRRAAFPSAVA